MCLILLLFLATSEWGAVVSGSTVTPRLHPPSLSISAQAPQTSHQQKPQLCSWQLSLLVRPFLLVTTADQRDREVNAHDPLCPCSSQHRTGTAEKRPGFSSLSRNASEVSVLRWLPESSMRIESQDITMTISLIMCILHVFQAFLLSPSRVLTILLVFPGIIFQIYCMHTNPWPGIFRVRPKLEGCLSSCQWRAALWRFLPWFFQSFSLALSLLLSRK